MFLPSCAFLKPHAKKSQFPFSFFSLSRLTNFISSKKIKKSAFHFTNNYRDPKWINYYYYCYVHWGFERCSRPNNSYLNLLLFFLWIDAFSFKGAKEKVGTKRTQPVFVIYIYIYIINWRYVKFSSVKSYCSFF